MGKATQDRYANARPAIKQPRKQDGIDCPNKTLGGGRRYAEQHGRQKRVEDSGAVHAAILIAVRSICDMAALLGLHDTFSSSTLGGCGLVERSAQTVGKLQRVVVRPEVHEESAAAARSACDYARRLRRCRWPATPDHRVHLVAGQHEIAGDGRFAAAGRLETDRGIATPIGPAGRQLHAVFGDRIPARHGQLIDAAVGLSLDADDLVDLRGVEFDGGGGEAAAGGAVVSCSRRSIPDSGGELFGIAVSADVHVEGRRRGPKHVIVDGGDLQPVCDDLTS